MAKKNRIQMPQSTAGLVRYFEESKSAIKLKPEHVLIASVVIIVAEIMINLMF
jgi:preprotein translocase subunit Sec61beta